jgi:hypothetical protein
VGTAACSPAQSCKATVHGAVEQLPRHVILHSSCGGWAQLLWPSGLPKAILAIGCSSASHFSSEIMKALRVRTRNKTAASLSCANPRKYKTEDSDRSITATHFFADVSREHVAAAAEFNVGVRCSCHS